MDIRLFESHKLEPGHPACAGCGAAIAMKIVSSVLPNNTRIVIPAGCWSIILGKYPFSSLKLPTIHTPFAFAAAFATGIKSALAFKNPKTPVVVWAGDGATYDIGFGLLSAAAERNEDILYICYDNEGYMNTGAQRSSSTPEKTVTPTTPKGKERSKKRIVDIMAEHDIPYVATASIAFPKDLIEKVKKALSIQGFKFILILSPCPTGWGFDPSLTIKIAHLAVECGLFPLIEIVKGQKRETYIPKGHPKEEYLKLQRRFNYKRK
ncbi:pyruvate ferredoxin oxidoreductase, beta subunit [Thermosulfidibacter takaii ABI70S6]|uniref:Pyruvate ferredoxin oxidoreductase, beta subunit n=1 Tax=Thermosulfidibacter takaii (strain DSM 17441 / JCM 13301 / NBRC 103674 / ABI70S6) TaxID=1298851 RepID=A0A0S3QU82_THET7|nr:thiamine pyrophosphate-dependent enzyme [Thermosulfidibacter takaii]BAT71868.1 pyruvate ferredoxin oxidoreductase, beta subunit [Thermosulfidibacter takaii ABI70S6]